MSTAVLILGNKAYSSWSLRGWLMCKIAGLAFEEAMHNMGAADWKLQVARQVPSGKVPCLAIDGALIWESLAIGEHLAERNLAAFYPADPIARAHARAIAAEMHAGFGELRKAMWMNVRRRFPGKRRTPGALADIKRIEHIWADTRARFGSDGPYLFGAQFGLADAMYAPVVARFFTWAPDLTQASQDYVHSVWQHPWMREWVAAAQAEPWQIAHYEDPDIS
jgi:glutathione S-transferase